MLQVKNTEIIKTNVIPAGWLLTQMIMPCRYTVPIAMPLQIIARNELKLPIIMQTTDVLRMMNRWK